MPNPKSKQYVVLGRVSHDGTVHHRGQQITLVDRDAAPLLNLKVIELAEPVSEEEQQELSNEVRLASMTKAQLVEYAAATYDLTLNQAATKADLIAQIEATAEEGKA